VKTLTLNVEELEQRIAPDATGAGGHGPPDNWVRPPFIILEPPVTLEGSGA
jgi:hypothetical protein